MPRSHRGTGVSPVTDSEVSRSSLLIAPGERPSLFVIYHWSSVIGHFGELATLPRSLPFAP